MRVLVTGSRKWRDREMVDAALDSWRETCGISVLIVGCASGADRMAEEWAVLNRIPLYHFPAEWARHGKAAGAIRNSRMLRDGDPEVVIAFHDDLRNSAGTGDMVHKAERAGIEVVLVTHPVEDVA